MSQSSPSTPRTGLRQVNTAAEKMYPAKPIILGSTAEELGLESCLSGPSSRTVDLEIGGAAGRWELRRGSFRQHGRPSQLLVLSDVSQALQAEELAAWKRLIRVIGHELNNSLAPITSLAGSLERVVDQDPLPDDWRSDLGSGLQVIASRVESLNRFMGDCSRLAKLPGTDDFPGRSRKLRPQFGRARKTSQSRDLAGGPRPS